MTAYLLLMPQTPMLFQGQEFATSSPFHFFADHHPELAKLVCAGRAKELAQFPSMAAPEMSACLLDPSDPQVFDRCKLHWEELEQEPHAQIFEFHKELLRLRRTDPVFARVQRRGDIDGAVLGPGAWVLRYFGKDNDDRLVLVNLQSDLVLDVAGSAAGSLLVETVLQRGSPLRRQRRGTRGNRRPWLATAGSLHDRAETGYYIRSSHRIG